MLRIYPSPPFRLDLTVWALRRLQINVIDRWDGTVYRRVFIRKNTPFEVAVKQSGTPHRPELLVRAEGISLGAELKAALIPTLAQMLGLGLRLAEFESLSQRDLSQCVRLPTAFFNGRAHPPEPPVRGLRPTLWGALRLPAPKGRRDASSREP